jgi:PAS domain S-box-containing protein
VNNPRPRSRFALAPETWRGDLLRIVLQVCAVLGAIVYVPSVIFSITLGNVGVVILDTAALATLLGLARFDRIPTRARAAACCLVLYALGAGLMIGVGSISLIYLMGFSLLTALLLDVRWGILSVGLNVATLLLIGYLDVGASEMAPPGSTFLGWAVITANVAFVNVSLVLVLGAVVSALEGALHRTGTAREALEHEQTALVALNESLASEVAERTRIAESLSASRSLLRIAGRTAHLGGWSVAVGDEHVEWSDEVCELHEVPPGTSPTQAEAIAFYAPEYRDAIREAVARCGDEGTAFDIEAEIITNRGARRWVRAIGNAARGMTGVVTHVHGSVQDITARKLSEAKHANLEAQFRQAQKMESFGALAGGIAHDFNNLMSVVVGYSELLVDDMGENDPIRADLEEIRNAGRRATDLTRQLLAFSRQQVLDPKVIDLSACVSDMESMLRRVIGEDIELAALCAPDLGKVLIDPGQIQQVIMNLALNARDAMVHGGMLTIETASILLDEQYAAEHVGVTPGMHVMLSVSDTGSGMDKATQARMFEPFFTTKEVGKGTGLGLATVFGIVQQSGGTIWVYSEPGVGTTFKLYFPIAGEIARPHAIVPHSEGWPLGGYETILLVEDEDTVRAMARTILLRREYRVLEARDGASALLLAEQYQGTIHLLVTDVVMPRMSGRQLAEQLLPARPAMKVLYMSGYTDDAVIRHGILEASVAFIQKPITPSVLDRKVREVLDVVPAA